MGSEDDLKRTTTLAFTSPSAALAGEPGPAAPSPGDLERGSSLGRYVVLDRVGGGGMGVVYTAYDPELDRKVAIKLLRRDLLEGAGPGRGGEEGRLRLLREAQALARLSHPNVVAVHDVGLVHEQVFVAMEFVRGRTLQDWLRDESPAWPAIVGVFRQAGRGLVAAHEAGLLHRDFKPSNVMLGDDGRARVLDFGLARPLESGAARDAGGRSPASSSGALYSDLTRTGFQLGTPAYMPPEQRQGRAADARSDQYSFCVAFYEALYGRHPFASEDRRTFFRRALAGEVGEPPAGSSVPLWLRRVLVRGLRPAPDDRYPSLQELLDDLDRTPRRRRRRVAVAALIVAAVVALYGYLRPDRAPLCQGSERKLRGVWDDSLRAAVREAFLATGLPYAGSVWGKTESFLDDYRASWTAARTDACEATHLRGEQSESLLDLRMACLDERLRELRVTVELLTRADDGIVYRALDTVGGLGHLESCSDADLLTAVVRPPEDDATRSEVERLRTEIAEARALRNAGKIGEALPIVEDAAAASAVLDYAPLVAEAHLELGRIRQQHSDDAGAVAATITAAAQADAGRHDEVKARALLDLAWFSGSDQRDFEEGRRWLDLADGAVLRLGDGHRFRGHWHQAAAVIYLEAGDYGRAEAEARNAYRSLLASSGSRHPDAVFALWTLGRVQHQQGHCGDALVAFEEIAVHRRELFGADHLQVAVAEQGIGECLQRLGRHPEALAPLRHALAVFEPKFGAEHPYVGTILNSLGNCHYGMGDWERARELYARVLEIRKGGPGADGAGVASALENLALAEGELGHLDKSAALLRQALALQRRASGAEHPKTLSLLVNLGRALLDRGKASEAARLFERAYGPIRANLGEDHPLIPRTTLGLGESALAEGRVDEALGWIRPTFDALADRDGEERLRARAGFALARVLWRQGRERQRARALAADARRLLASLGPAGRRQLEQVDAWLADPG